MSVTDLSTEGPREPGAPADLAAGLAFETLRYLGLTFLLHPAWATWRDTSAPAVDEDAPQGWLAFYPLAYACVVLLLRTRVRRWHVPTWLDGVIASCGLGAVAIAVVFQAVLVRGEGNAAAAATALAYPVGDLLLLVLLAGALAAMGWRAKVAGHGRQRPRSRTAHRGPASTCSWSVACPGSAQ